MSFPSRDELSAFAWSGKQPAARGLTYPTMYAWEGTGAWVLELTDENWDEYSSLPPTLDDDEHTENLKKMGATWYANPRDHKGAARILDLERGDCRR